MDEAINHLIKAINDIWMAWSYMLTMWLRLNARWNMLSCKRPSCSSCKIKLKECSHKLKSFSCQNGVLAGLEKCASCYSCIKQTPDTRFTSSQFFHIISEKSCFVAYNLQCKNGKGIRNYQAKSLKTILNPSKIPNLSNYTELPS